ncbi:hypothetical protein T05_9828 [Trichinella murrelli]|uniref:Uncharacterized protein n=1 Tax=Trichinella murrelli TaxID=144512 RepID=A0A0V0TQC3_9BILA|nr:hypothetical protein T05_9828 [Trichinella murrelli]
MGAEKPPSCGSVFTPAESTVENTQPALEPSETELTSYRSASSFVFPASGYTQSLKQRCYMRNTTDFTMKKCVFYDAWALKNHRLIAVSSLQLNRQLKIPSLHWSRLSDTVNTNHYTGTMPPPGAFVQLFSNLALEDVTIPR